MLLIFFTKSDTKFTSVRITVFFVIIKQVLMPRSFFRDGYTWEQLPSFEGKEAFRCSGERDRHRREYYPSHARNEPPHSSQSVQCVYLFLIPPYFADKTFAWMRTNDRSLNRSNSDREHCPLKDRSITNLPSRENSWKQCTLLLNASVSITVGHLPDGLVWANIIFPVSKGDSLKPVSIKKFM